MGWCHVVENDLARSVECSGSGKLAVEVGNKRRVVGVGQPGAHAIEGLVGEPR
jgi:hypothetical protein